MNYSETWLPIGSVVLLKNSTKRVMIMGFCQKKPDDDTLFDYCGVYYPEGYMDGNHVFLFSRDQIDKIYAVGYLDEEQFEFQKKLEAFRPFVDHSGVQ